MKNNQPTNKWRKEAKAFHVDPMNDSPEKRVGGLLQNDKTG